MKLIIIRMARVKLNPIIKSVSGKFGHRLMLKKYGDTTVLSSVPRKPERRTDAQKACAAKFRDAARFAKASLRNGTIKAYYNEICRQRDQHSAYAALLKDVLNSAVPLTEQQLLDNANKASLTEEKPKERKNDLEVIVRMANGEIIVQGCALSLDRNQWTYKAPYSGIEVWIKKV